MVTGFIHGVMNTDNMAVSGETIDYGPCAFLEAYNPVPFSVPSIPTDAMPMVSSRRSPTGTSSGSRRIVPLFDDASPDQAVAQATEVLNAFSEGYEGLRLTHLRAKLGLTTAMEEDAAIADDWLVLLEKQSVDFTLAWRRLADAAAGDARPLESLFRDGEELRRWFDRWQQRLGKDRLSAAARAMTFSVNPIYIPRNHLVEEALSAATAQGDLTLFERLLEAVTRPFDERPG